MTGSGEGQETDHVGQRYFPRACGPLSCLSGNGASVLGVSMWMPAWEIYPGSRHPYLLEQDL